MNKGLHKASTSSARGQEEGIREDFTEEEIF